jgi:chromosome segregation ATPase
LGILEIGLCQKEDQMEKPPPTNFNEVHQVFQSFREWAAQVQSDLDALTGRVVTMEHIEALHKEAENIKAQLQQLPAELAAAREKVERIEANLAAQERIMTRSVTDYLLDLTEVKGTKAERQAAAERYLEKNDQAYIAAGLEANTLGLDLIVAAAELNELKDRDHQLGRLVQVHTSQMNTLASQITAIITGGKND